MRSGVQVAGHARCAGNRTVLSCPKGPAVQDGHTGWKASGRLRLPTLSGASPPAGGARQEYRLSQRLSLPVRLRESAGSPSHRPVPVVFPARQPAATELHPQPLPFADDEPGGDRSSLRVINVRTAAPTSHERKRAFEGGGGSVRGHAECQRQRVRAHAVIRTGGQPSDTPPHNGLAVLSLIHRSTPDCYIACPQRSG